MTNSSSPAFAENELSPALTVDLDALSRNYRTLRKNCHGAELAAVVKANAYGLGIEKIVPALVKAGCRTFFVATASEADELRELAPDNDIYVMNGLTCDGSVLVDRKLSPCLGSAEEITNWMALCEERGKNLPAAIHIDTGFNRLGIRPKDWPDAVRQIKGSRFSPALLMSHLACSENPRHAMNAGQLEAFRSARELLPGVRASLSNSGGVFLGPDFGFDMVRSGIALYGSVEFDTRPAQLENVVFLEAPILQLRDVPAGETVGYGCDFTAKRDSRIAVLGIGYADGIFRHLGGLNGAPAAMKIALDGQMLPVVGRMSMDLTTVDVTDFKGKPHTGMLAELIGAHIPLAEFARRANTVSYEVLTRLGTRYKRYYGKSDQP